MRLIVVGNGMAGVLCSKFLRESDFQAEIDIFAEEKYHYYPRPNLIEFLAGRMPEERLFAFNDDWYDAERLNIHLGAPVRSMLPDKQRLVLDGKNEEKYDILLLANGARPFVPPIKGTDKKRVFTLRTLDDCLEIIDSLEKHPRVTVLGGGLLGLEIARALKTRGAQAQVVEFFPRLLPRQLDEQGASLLKSQIEEMGIPVHLGLACEEILGPAEAAGLRFKGGREMKTQTVIIAAGVRPDIGLAGQAGLAIDRGIKVNHQLQTSDQKVFAVGDNIEHDGRVYGIIPAVYEQVKTAASVISGEKMTYKGTIPSNTLKVVGLDVTSIGVVNPEEKEFQEFRTTDDAKGIYKKVVVHQKRLVGAVLIGTKKGAAEFNRLITDKTDISQWQENLLEDDFDFSGL